jgi:hypothetical protein
MADNAGSYSQDVLTRIYNVQWEGGEGVFVSGDGAGYARYSKDGQNWTGLGNLDFFDASPHGGSGQIIASSYALAGTEETPVFLLGGNAAPKPDVEIYPSAVIMASRNGSNWTNVFNLKSDHSHATVVTGLVRDETDKTFYANINFFDSDGHLLKKCYRSSDGFGWAEGGGTFESHCKGKLPGKPDGYYGYDEAKDILIRPSDDGSGVIVKKRVGVSDPPVYETTLVTSGAMVDMTPAAVAYAAGTWVTVGGGDPTVARACTASSIDDGTTWIMVSKGNLGMKQDADIRTVIGGAPLVDAS